MHAASVAAEDSGYRAPPELMNFVLAVQALTDAGLEYAIIDGWSAIMHGSAHLTNDLDLCYSRSPDNLRRLALAPYHPRPADFPRELPFVVCDHQQRTF